MCDKNFMSIWAIEKKLWQKMWVAPFIRLQKKGGGSVSVNNQLSLHRNNNENPSMRPAVKGETAVSILDENAIGRNSIWDEISRDEISRDENVQDICC